MREQIVRFTEKQDTVNMRTYTRVLGPTFGKERPLKRDSEYRPFFRSVFEVNSYLLTCHFAINPMLYKPNKIFW